MRKIMVLNAKGGCGKTTITTNLASYYACVEDAKVVIADFDPQGSSLDWLKARPEEVAEIIGINACTDPIKVARNTDYVIFDVPAGTSGKTLSTLVRKVETIIIPVLPSPIDIRACSRFIHELLLLSKVSRKKVKLAVVANRVKENTTIYHDLEKFLKRLRIPFVTHFRDSMNYIHSAQYGIGVCELAASSANKDFEQWQPLVKWLASKRSLPNQ